MLSKPWNKLCDFYAWLMDDWMGYRQPGWHFGAGIFFLVLSAVVGIALFVLVTWITYGIVWLLLFAYLLVLVPYHIFKDWKKHKRDY
jgi:hypothetical protein